MSTRQFASSGSAWEPVFGYSRAVREGNHVFVSGTVGRNEHGGPAAGAFEQAKRAIEIIAAALQELGAGLEDVVRTRVYVTDINLFEEIARAHEQAFGTTRPASSIVEVRRLIDDAYLVEIEAHAVVS
jgi:enamine deaminase RidA (YjgF/YER057c/UK114 family)